MKAAGKTTVLCCAAVLWAGAAMAQDVFIYPQKGQSQEQQSKDEYECYNWAKNSSGFDPMAVPTTSSAAPSGQAKSGTLVKGGLAGAAIGGLLGGRSGAGKGALAGGLIGGVSQHSHNRQVEEERQGWEQQETANYANQRNSYNRAFSACMEGRGYTVK